MKYWTTKEEKYLVESIRKGIPYKQIAEDLGRTMSSLHSKISKIRKTTTVKRKPKVDTKEYALYKDDKWIVDGTIEEIAKHEKVSISTIQYYKTPSYKNRRKKGKKYKELIKL